MGALIIKILFFRVLNQIISLTKDCHGASGKIHKASELLMIEICQRQAT